MPTQSIISTSQHWIPFIVFIGLLVGVWIIHYLIAARLHQLARKSTSQLDDIFITELEKPSRWLLIFLIAILSLPFAPEEVKKITWIMPLLRAGAIVSFFIGMTHTLVALVRSKQILSTLSNTNEALLLTVIRILTGVTCLMVILDSFGVSVAPLIASLGIGSLAVALALQDTLGNYFSGLYILIDKPIRIGDFVRIEGGVEGHVERIGWRSTLIKQLSNNIVVVPNSKLASSIITNMSLPDSLLYLTFDMGVSYSSDLDKVEQIALSAARELQQEAAGACKDFTPLFRYTGFGSSSIDFRIILKAQAFEETQMLRHDFMKRLFQKFNQAQIEIPFPQIVVHNSKSH